MRATGDMVAVAQEEERVAHKPKDLGKTLNPLKSPDGCAGVL